MKNIPELHLRAVQIVKEFQSKEKEVLSIIQQVDEQEIYKIMGCSTLFSYLTEKLNLTESQAYTYSTVSRKSREVPKLKEAVDSGLSIYKAQRIVPILTKENQEEWINKAKVLPKAELEKQIANVNPTATYRESLRIVAKDRISMKIEITEEEKEKLKRVQTLLSTAKRKNLNLEETLNEVLDFYLEKKDPLRKLETKRLHQPCPGKTKKILTRHISHFRKLELIRRDKLKCTYKSPDGKTCGEERFVQIHHLRHWSQGGSHDLENLQTLCEAHHRMKHRKLA